ncbi:MAG TPA: PAS domain-containing protein [Chloroflexia bacterium]|nr:PAS domain-containing protein [Chloroflexia bacterium]
MNTQLALDSHAAQGTLIAAPPSVFFETIKEGVVTLTVEHTIAYCNTPLTQMLKSDRDNILGSSIFQFVAPAGRAALATLLESAGQEATVTLLTRDGAAVPVTVACDRMYLADGAVCCLIVQDLTRQVPDDLYRLISAAGRDLILLCDPAGRYLFAGASLRRMLGYDPIEVIGSNLLDGFLPDDQAAARDQWSRLGTLGVATLTGRYRHADGSWRTLTISATAVLHSGAPYVFALGQDVTEQQRIESALRRNLEAQENERRHLARELHDEIGQVLTAVKIRLQAIQQARRRTTRAALLAEGQDIVNQALEQVRDLSLGLRPSLLDDFGLVAAMQWYANRVAEHTGLVVQFVADPLESRLPPIVETTCFRVTQEALTNVLRHAAARQAGVELRRQGDTLRLTIQDDGIGFDVRNSLEQAVHGASLGLLGMHERVLLAGGQITIQSAPAQGTQITVCFPL